MAVDFVSELGLPFVAHRMRRLSELFVAGYAGWLEEMGVTAPPRSLSTLLLLRREPELGVTEVAQQLKFTHPLIIALIKQLETGGFVTTVRDPADGRRRRISLTAKGLEETQRIDSATQVMSRTFRTLFEDSGVDLLDAVERIEKACAALPFDERLRRAATELDSAD